MNPSSSPCSIDRRGSDIVLLSTTARYKADVSAAAPQTDTQFRWDGSPTVCQPGDYEAINQQHQCILQDEAADFSKRAEELTCTLSSTTYMLSTLSRNTVVDDGNTHRSAVAQVQHTGVAVGEDVRVTLLTAVTSPREQHYDVTTVSLDFDCSKAKEQSL
ncbi:hypothetical protein STCU_09911 [Strigomonas culicis]|uniref:Uncharacterized protein n=1 Tax=Strigomonas culicis TaxID=28005 RepID=S9TP09_9TRYP|nr:hypothetical protein STCU_09911 [Strigomonas culicis]|eukprot:EPY18439.1 hypothetical protein STCU_09911 [Strigomonas culicis]